MRRQARRGFGGRTSRVYHALYDIADHDCLAEDYEFESVRGDQGDVLARLRGAVHGGRGGVCCEGCEDGS